jgi:predicted HicB family RNase H-like nuclease
MMPSQPAPDDARFELHLPQDLKKAAKRAASDQGESLSAVIRRALEAYVRSANARERKVAR